MRLKEFAVVAVAVFAATPMFAASAKRKVVVAPASIVAAQPSYSSNTAFAGPDPWGVYVDGRKVGTDPDPRVRYQMYNDYYRFYHY